MLYSSNCFLVACNILNWTEFSSDEFISNDGRTRLKSFLLNKSQGAYCIIFSIELAYNWSLFLY